MTRLLLAAAAVALAIPAAGAGSRGGLPTAIGRGEGKLTLLTWEGYAEREWVVPFERRTGCDVDARYARSPDEMVSLLRQDPGRYDLVSASGDVALRLVAGKLVRAVNVRLVPDWKRFVEPLRSPAFNTVGGVHYGISSLWGANLLLYDAAKVRPAPTSWSAIYDPNYKGRITVPDNRLQIADAALYLASSKRDLRIADPYNLTRTQFDAALALLRAQRRLVSSYWDHASDEVRLFERGKAWLGPGWQYQADRLADDGVRATIPREGATGWADSWLLSSRARHPNCGYLWLRWISTPQVAAELAVFFGAAPANPLACPYMNRIAPGSCVKYHADAPSSYARSIRFWKTPGAGCKACVGDAAWDRAWKQLTR